MRRRFCGGTSHISDMLENGIWVITLYEGIIKEIGTTIGS